MQRAPSRSNAFAAYTLLQICFFSLLVGVEALGQFVCAHEGKTLCGSSSDMEIVDTATFARSITRAGTAVYFSLRTNPIPGKEALASVLGSSVLSDGCLACQGSSIDCGMVQRDCLPICLANACGRQCRSCMQKYCDVKVACGGLPGETIQMPYICAAGGNEEDMSVDRTLLDIQFIGNCTSRFDHATELLP
eukprot:TRINITY_DN28418_c0_g1_i1.p2 TRINITY_DN28418_c0_g1~~TRINITY_DN28418_c0_g1_i1.p2  ORF type:complete len:192 (-),score=28.86 TRINITY_DN28418_c0_g1_i1:191-766(-)